MNPDELAALCQRVDAADPPPEIRLCCPRGHFIAAVSIIAPKIYGARQGMRPVADDDDLTIAPAHGHYHHYVSAVAAERGRERINHEKSNTAKNPNQAHHAATTASSNTTPKHPVTSRPNLKRR